MQTNKKNIKLSEVEINKLFQFTEKKFVHWYDLQIEIVDHLASCIEEEMESDDKLTFDAALEKVYRGFGIYGFAKIVQERQHQLYLSAKKTWFNELKTTLSWPKIILVFLALASIWTISGWIETYTLYTILFVLYACLSLYFFVIILRDRKLKKRLLLIECVNSYYYSGPYTFELFLIISRNNIPSMIMVYILATGMFFKIISIYLYRKIRLEAKYSFPLAFE